jgi:sirohydrochlorin ferrochelatase
MPLARGAPVVLLVDNGSLEPAATLALRALAARLAADTQRAVRPVSLLHSSTVDPARLAGRPAEILEPVLRALGAVGAGDVVVVPLFLGPSAAVTEYLPARVRHLRRTWPHLQVRLAPCLVDLSRSDDARIATLLAERTRGAAAAAGFSRPAVAVVDHGTPRREVNAVREHVTAQVRALLGGWTRVVAASSMERRPGAEHDFNEPLLETLLDTTEFASGEVVVAQLFLQPGRHAGPGGDIEQIVRAAQTRHPGLRVAMTEPLGSHPGLVAILAERLAEGLRAEAIE